MATRKIRVIQTPGGPRCQATTGKKRFVKCPSSLRGIPRRTVRDSDIIRGYDDMGDLGKLSGVAVRRSYIPGKGVRCWDARGKFTSCDIPMYGTGDLGMPQGVRRQTRRRTRRRVTKRH